jgi:hypothetical protein
VNWPSYAFGVITPFAVCAAFVAIIGLCDRLLQAIGNNPTLRMEI